MIDKNRNGHGLISKYLVFSCFFAGSLNIWKAKFLHHELNNCNNGELNNNELDYWKEASFLLKVKSYFSTMSSNDQKNTPLQVMTPMLAMKHTEDET